MVKIPSYIEFANTLRKDINSGKYGTEGGLPGIEELARRSGLSINTIYRSLSLLVGERLIEQRDKAYYVNGGAIPMNQYIPPHFMIMRAQGKTAFADNIVPVEIVTLPDEIAEMLDVAENLPVTHRLRVLGEIENGKKKPLWLVEYYYLVSLTDEQRSRMQEDPHLHILLETGPVDLVRFDKISSHLLTKEECQHLQSSNSSVSLRLQSTVRDLNGNILLFQDLTLLGVTLTYEYTFENKPQA